MRKYEKIDIINQQDKVIKTIVRTEEWEKAGRPDSHRVIQVIVENSEGQIVIQRRPIDKSFMPNTLDASVGGLVSAGMTYEETAIKEMQEELGITADVEFIAKRWVERDGILPGNMLATFKALSDGPYTGGEFDEESLETLEPKELLTMIKESPNSFTPMFILSLEKYLAQ